jgi:hypothetical protein
MVDSKTKFRFDRIAAAVPDIMDVWYVEKLETRPDYQPHNLP